MRKIVLLLLISFVSLHAIQNIWSENTNGMSEKKGEQVINAYLLETNIDNIIFEDDAKIKKRKLSINENIFIFGLSIGANSAQDTIQNTKGSKSLSNTAYEAKLTIGKDFTFLHERFTQPTRLYFSLNYSALGKEVDVIGWSLGIRENMSYWDFYTTPTYTIYPSLSFEFGSSTMTRDDISIDGFTMEVDLGVTYQRGNNLEYFINFKASNNDWKYASAGETFEGIDYETFSVGLLVGLNYKFNYGDY